MAEPGLLNVEGLSKTFHIKSQGRSVPLQAVRNVSFSLASGRTLALVGESGCGKTTTGRLILRLIEPDGGSVRFEDRDLRTLNPRELRSQRRSMQIIFQDPMGSLNPRMTVGSAILEPLRLHRQDAGSAKERLAELLSEVELDPSYARRYPHELSGGQRQRVAIARALALHPKLIVADEPVSALDASIQSQVLNLLARLQASHGIAFLFISHDLAVVRHIADDVAVMYRGEIVEYGSAEQVFGKPSHPYTVALLAAIPRPDAAAAEVRALAPGQPDADQQSLGCSFASRCQHSMDICRRQSPEAFGLEAGHYSRCWLNKGGGQPSGACHEN